MASRAFTPLTLPNGSILKNRIAKAAMEENMASIAPYNSPSPNLITLYRSFSHGGASLILSGHIMIDPLSMALPGDVLLCADTPLNEALWRDWINASQENGAQFWLQLNHPGRQVQKGSGLPTYAPSAVKMKMGALSSLFEVPVAMSEEQILDVVERFAWAARKAEELGAKGIEVHAAHGYLISQFLSPLTNLRTDRWGGSLENRARLLFEVIKAVRAAVGRGFGVGIKINSADFQRGGFDTGDLYWVVERLNGMGVDLVEISGGSYEMPAMFGSKPEKASTVARKAYFLEAASKIQTIAEMPIMVTGGIKRLDVLESVVSSCDTFVAGVGTAIGLMPDLPNRWARGEDPAPELSDSWVLSHTLSSAAKTTCVQYNMQLVGKGRDPWLGVWPVYALVLTFLYGQLQMRQYKGWMQRFVKDKEDSRKLN